MNKENLVWVNTLLGSECDGKSIHFKIFTGVTTWVESTKGCIRYQCRPNVDDKKSICVIVEEGQDLIFYPLTQHMVDAIVRTPNTDIADYQCLCVP